MPTKAGTRVERKVRRKGHDAPGQPAPLQGTVREPQGKATWLVSWVSGREQTLKSRQLVIIRNPGSSVGQPAAQRQPGTQTRHPALPSSSQDDGAQDGAGLGGVHELDAMILYPARAEAKKALPAVRSAAEQRMHEEQHPHVYHEPQELPSFTDNAELANAVPDSAELADAEADEDPIDRCNDVTFSLGDDAETTGEGVHARHLREARAVIKNILGEQVTRNHKNRVALSWTPVTLLDFPEN